MEGVGVDKINELFKPGNFPSNGLKLIGSAADWIDLWCWPVGLLLWPNLVKIFCRFIICGFGWF